MRWSVTLPGACGVDGPLLYRYLIAQVDDHLVVSVLATAPSRQFDSAAGLARSMESFRPHA